MTKEEYITVFSLVPLFIWSVSFVILFWRLRFDTPNTND